MPPPLKGRALVDELCFKLPTYLQEQLGVTQIQVDARAGCTAADLDGFERNTGYALPDDLRAFLAVSNGLKCDWAVDVKTRGPADVGALRLHRLAPAAGRGSTARRSPCTGGVARLNNQN